MAAAGYLRFPHVHGDLVTFIADDDVWLAPAAGGRAWRVSADHAAASHPRFSPDGSLIAWTSRRRRPARGLPGRPRRRARPQAQLLGRPANPDLRLDTGRRRARDHRRGPAVRSLHPGLPAGRGARRRPRPRAGCRSARSRTWPWPDGGTALLNGRLPRPRVLEAVPGRHLGAAVGRPARPRPRPRAGSRRVLAGLDSQFASPMLVGGRLAFLSDHEGTGNLYSCALDGTDLRRHTDHDGFYARNASTDGQPHRLPLRGRHLAARRAGRRRAPAGSRSASARRPAPRAAADLRRGSPRRAVAATRPARPARSRSAGPCTG